MKKSTKIIEISLDKLIFGCILTPVEREIGFPFLFLNEYTTKTIEYRRIQL